MSTVATIISTTETMSTILSEKEVIDVLNSRNIPVCDICHEYLAHRAMITDHTHGHGGVMANIIFDENEIISGYIHYVCFGCCPQLNTDIAHHDHIYRSCTVCHQ